MTIQRLEGFPERSPGGALSLMLRSDLEGDRPSLLPNGSKKGRKTLPNGYVAKERDRVIP